MIDPHHHGLGSEGNLIGDHGLPSGTEPAKHMVDGIVARRIHADSQSRVVGRAQMVLNVAQPIVATVRSPLSIRSFIRIGPTDAPRRLLSL